MGAFHTFRGTVACIAPLDRTGSRKWRLEQCQQSFSLAIVAGLLLGTTALASAQTLVYPQYGYNYGYNGYTPIYPPAITFPFGVAPELITHRAITIMLLPTSLPATMVGTSRLEPLVSRNPTFIFDATAAPRARLLLSERSTCTILATISASSVFTGGAS